MSRCIDTEELKRIKFHPLPYTHIIPTDCEAESYMRGWNDAVDVIVEKQHNQCSECAYFDGMYCNCPEAEKYE